VQAAHRVVGRTRSRRGQSLVELSLVLPILSAILGGAIDLARVYEAQITLQSAARNAAEAAASEAGDVTEAQTIARRIVCIESQGLPGFVPGGGGNVETCTSPAVAVTFSRSTTAPGASTWYPLGTATVEASLDFDMLLPWPLLPDGGWTLDPEHSYSVFQGR
jgi:Flp pilus assembly protein TadG